MFKKFLKLVNYSIITTIISLLHENYANACISSMDCTHTINGLSYCRPITYAPRYISYILFAIYILTICCWGIKKLRQQTNKTYLTNFFISILFILKGISIFAIIAVILSAITQSDALWRWELYDGGAFRFILENFLLFFPFLLISAWGIKKLNNRKSYPKLSRFLCIIYAFPLLISLLITALHFIFIFLVTFTESLKPYDILHYFHLYGSWSVMTLSAYKATQLHQQKKLQKKHSFSFWMLCCFTCLFALNIIYSTINLNNSTGIFTHNLKLSLWSYLPICFLCLQILSYGIQKIFNQTKLSSYFNQISVILNRTFTCLAILLLILAAVYMSIITEFITYGSC